MKGRVDHRSLGGITMKMHNYVNHFNILQSAIVAYRKSNILGIAEARKPTSSECSAAADEGPCGSSITRWYYDENAQLCKPFQYSGCGGNGNNYGSKFACERRCAPVFGAGKCLKGVEPLKTIHGAPVNCAKTPCPSGYKCSVVQQISVCCPISDPSKEAGVLHSGVNADVCQLPKERGPCDRYELRFYYNNDLKECKYFFFGGCEGNGNNFERVEDCEKTCGRELPEAEEEDPAKGTTVTELSTRQLTSASTRASSLSIAERTEAVTRTDSSSSHFQSETSPSLKATEKQQASSGSDSDSNAADIEENEIKAGTTEPIESPSQTIQLSRLSKMETFTPNSPMQTTHPVEPLAPLISKQDIGTPAESLLPENRCIHARDPGDCNGQFVRWYWDSNVKMCEVFTYTGCNGNGNNFASREECISVCHREDALPAAIKVEQPDLANVCEHEVDAGECKGEFQRFAFDAKLGECRAFVYGGCGGNGNNFASITDCQRKCHSEGSTLSTNVCEHPIEVGECSGVFARFAYDSVANECRQFTYGGCGGNGNNFATLADCRTLCVKVKCPPEPRCDLTRCQLVNDAQGCPFCSCPPPHQPHPPTGRPIERPDCPPLDVMLCIEPCIIFSNRRGCQECVCPVIPPNNVVEATNSITGPVSPTGTLPTVQTDRPPSPPSSPAAPSSAAPPASVSMPAQPPRQAPSSAAPPASFSMPAQPPRQASVPILKSFDKGPLVSQQQAEKPRQPYPLTPASRIPNIADLGEKCTQPLVSKLIKQLSILLLTYSLGGFSYFFVNIIKIWVAFHMCFCRCIWSGIYYSHI
uniref:Papilin n=1 Tax=Ascaris lumbricoides TaxID=6252 RepID=A0A0M3IQG7_ASCLU